MKEDQSDVVINAVIRPDQKAMLNQIAKDDDRSVSGALRFVLDDWVEMKKRAIQAAAPTETETLTA
jgi:hypothetical protein